MKNKSKVILVVLLVLAVGYIVFDKYSEARFEKEKNIYNAGASYGYESAVTQIAQMASTCDVVPLIIDNQTLNVIALDCVEQES